MEEGTEVRDQVRQAMEELAAERRQREELEKRVSELVEEASRNKKAAAEAEKNLAIRAELERLGVSKVELAFRALRSEVERTEEGELVGRNGGGAAPLREYVTRFVAENPEVLPVRVGGGSGAGAQGSAGAGGIGGDLDRLRPGMSDEELERIRREITRVAAQALRGQ
ncbi:MAG: hypothetical protein K2X35_12070 [Bryobacteraceae bacterium]|nr:hypothetical protein [Bryobacteraceae bacterium]